MPRPNVEKERRKQILEASMACFARKGYHATSMDDITAELPFSKALIYYYFKTKRDIFLAILDNFIETGMGVWQMMIDANDDATTKLRKCLEYGVNLIIQFKDLSRVEFEFYAEASRDEEVRQAIQRLFSTFREEFNKILDEGVESGEFRPINSEALSAVLFGVYEGLAMQAMVETDNIDWQIVLDSLLDMVMRGIAV